jgi:DNA-binding NarL/FixJ family response regulator
MKIENDFKIIVVDDHELFRKGVIMVIEKLDFVEIIGEASTGKELLQLLKTNNPDAILMDIKMPEMDGVTATKRVLELYPDIKIIALSMFGEEIYLEKMIVAGAQGFLLKSTNSNELKNAIQTIAIGQQYYSEEFLPYFTNKYISGSTAKGSVKLTKREHEVLTLVGQGLTNRGIADKLFISIKTVINHRANLNSKTGSNNTAKLLAFAIKNKLIEY